MRLNEKKLLNSIDRSRRLELNTLSLFKYSIFKLILFSISYNQFSEAKLYIFIDECFGYERTFNWSVTVELQPNKMVQISLKNL